MSAHLLITDDVHRGRRLASDLVACGTWRVHDLYDEAVPAGSASLILSDVEGLHSEALVRLRRILDRARGEGVPYLFLVHRNAARAEAQARILGVTDTLAVSCAARLITDKLTTMGKIGSIAVAARKQAVRARAFLTDAFFSGQAITPAVAETGTELIVQAIRETDINEQLLR